MDRQMIEGMLGDALEREIITAKMVDGAYPPAVAVGILDGPGREIGFGHGESQLTVILPDIGDCARFVDSCKALGGKVPLGTYGGELVSAMARELEREESAPALAALESALDGARRGGYGGRRGPRPPSPPSPGRPPRPRQPRSRRPARSPTLPARSRKTPRPGTDTIGVRMRPQALWHTHANAQPRIHTYPYIRIRVYA